MKETIVIEKKDLKIVLNLLRKLMDFYAKLYDCYHDGRALERESFELNEMIWDLGLNLPSWDD